MNNMTTETKQVPILSIRGLSTQFSTPSGLLKAVQDVSLDVMPGECVGIVGESGSGKSVSFASVMGLIKPPGQIAAGEVIFDGTDLRKLSAEALRRIRGKQIAMTMQDALTALNPAMTIEQQLLEVIHRIGMDFVFVYSAAVDECLVYLSIKLFAVCDHDKCEVPG